MKVCEKVDRRELQTALGICGRVTPRRPLNDVLGFVKLSTEGIEANDGELRVKIASTYQGDPILLPFQKLSELTRLASGDSFELETTKTKANLKTDSGEWQLPTAEPIRWPEIQKEKRHPVARVAADQLARGISAVIDATDQQAGMVALGGVLVDVTDGLVTLVASDGRRLFSHEIEIDQAVDDCQLLMTHRTATLVGVLAGQISDEGEVQIERTASEIFFDMGGGGGAEVIARQHVGTFPAWRKKIPAMGRATPTTVRADKFCEAIKQAAICSSEDSRAIELTLGKKIVAEADSSESGKSCINLEPLEAGKAVKLRINPQFCVEWLRRIDPSEPITIEAVDASSPVVFRSEDSTGVIMPMEGGRQ